MTFDGLEHAVVVEVTRMQKKTVTFHLDVHF